MIAIIEGKEQEDSPTVTNLAHEGYDSCAGDYIGGQKGRDKTMSALFRKIKPAVPRYWLMLLAGLMWTAVGIGLSVTACTWFSNLDWPQNGLGVFLGFGSGIVIYRYGFSRIAKRNLERISSQPNEVCVFAFQAWRSYLLILGMMVLGAVLRHSAVHRLVLGVIYAAMGTALTLSSALYYEAVFGPGDST
jgi:hypothetical protein